MGRGARRGPFSGTCRLDTASTPQSVRSASPCQPLPEPGLYRIHLGATLRARRPASQPDDRFLPCRRVIPEVSRCAGCCSIAPPQRSRRRSGLAARSRRTRWRRSGASHGSSSTTRRPRPRRRGGHGHSIALGASTLLIASVLLFARVRSTESRTRDWGDRSELLRAQPAGPLREHEPVVARRVGPRACDHSGTGRRGTRGNQRAAFERHVRRGRRACDSRLGRTARARARSASPHRSRRGYRRMAPASGSARPVPALAPQRQGPNPSGRDAGRFASPRPAVRRARSMR